MALNYYGVLKGRPIDFRYGSSSNPHFQIHLVDDSDDWRIAVNVQSQDGSEVEYVTVRDFHHPITDRIRELPAGFTRLLQAEKGGLDFIRSNLVQPQDFRPLPATAPGPDNDLNEMVDQFVQRAMADEASFVYAFGDRWGPESGKKDKIFGFKPGNGIHDIHMNQGNSGRFAADNGVYQDGGLLFHFPSNGTWAAVFMKFQTQAWHSDDAAGEPLIPATSGPPSNGMDTTYHIGPTDLPTTVLPDGMVRIAAALVNDVKSPEDERVTLINRAPTSVELSGWKLLDQADRELPLSGQIAAGAALTVHVRPALELSNKGGLITLVNADGLKVHGVRYTKEQARHPGWTITF